MLALHVLDEAVTDFLSVYNPIIASLRARYWWFPMPMFDFGIWLTGLTLGIAVLLALAPLAYRGTPWLRVAAYPFAAIMFLNGVGHLAGSIYFWRWMPGATTAPLLLAGSTWLFLQARAARMSS